MYKAGMLKNTSNGRFHPVIFRPAPFPGPGPEKVLRYRSLGHHTTGFAELADAEASIVEQGWERVDHLAEWDGQGIPAETILLPATA
ncbi:hypothetical protein [uncultured Bosea sp.]|uniref:hypothetical protein n=1 Tax=uncultured Bosea sp. TaxID=211457 RepID=UPI0025FC609B|nr:hypothetical protein [uncultured Bosea sp.]